MDQREPKDGMTPMTLFLVLVLTAVLSGGGVFVWHRMAAEQAQRIYEKNIEDLQTQRDILLGQRAGLQRALDALQEKREED